MCCFLLFRYEEDEAGSEAEQTTNSVDVQTTTAGRDKEGVFIIFTDGEVALDGFYYNGQRHEFVGHKGRVLGTSCHCGQLIVATLMEANTCMIAAYSLQVVPLVLHGRLDGFEVVHSLDVLKQNNWSEKIWLLFGGYVSYA